GERDVVGEDRCEPRWPASEHESERARQREQAEGPPHDVRVVGVEVVPALPHQPAEVRSVVGDSRPEQGEDEQRGGVTEEARHAERDRLAEGGALPGRSPPLALRGEDEAGREEEDEEDESREGGGQSFAFAPWALALVRGVRSGRRLGL